MTQQFTASEVRDLAKRGTDAMQQFIDGRHTLHIPPQHDDADMVIAECLRAMDAFADLLEAREKAKPVMIVNHVSSAEHDLPIGMKLYTHPSPSDAERLAEALRCALTWIEVAPHADSCGDADAYNHTELRSCGCGKDAIVENLTEALAIHSAQAHPPAASVMDAMQELADKYHELLWAVARKFPGETRHETALRYIREAECQEAVLATQENPND